MKVSGSYSICGCNNNIQKCSSNKNVNKNKFGFLLTKKQAKVFDYIHHFCPDYGLDNRLLASLPGDLTGINSDMVMLKALSYGYEQLALACANPVKKIYYRFMHLKMDRKLVQLNNY